MAAMDEKLDSSNKARCEGDSEANSGLLENDLDYSQATEEDGDRVNFDKISAAENSFNEHNSESSWFLELLKTQYPNVCDLLTLLRTDQPSEVKFLSNSEHAFMDNLNSWLVNLNESTQDSRSSSTPVPNWQNSFSVCSSSGVSSGSRNSPESPSKTCSSPKPSHQKSATAFENLNNDSISTSCNQFGSAMLEAAQLFQAETIFIGQKTLDLVKSCSDNQKVFNDKLSNLQSNPSYDGSRSNDIIQFKDLTGSHFKIISEIKENLCQLIKAKLLEDTALAHIWLHITKSGKHWDLPFGSLFLRKFPQTISLLFDKWFEETNAVMETIKTSNKKVEHLLSEMLGTRSILNFGIFVYQNDLSCGWDLSLNTKFNYASRTPYTHSMKLKKELQLVQDNSFAEHQSLNDDHHQRICSLISDHDLQLKSAMERAKNARQQSASLQLQLIHLQNEMSNKLRINTKIINDLENQIQQQKENNSKEAEELRMKCQNLETKVKSYKKELLQTILDRENLIISYKNESAITSDYMNKLEEELSNTTNAATLIEEELNDTILQNKVLKEKEKDHQMEMNRVYSEILALINKMTDTSLEQNLETESKVNYFKNNQGEISSNILTAIENCKHLMSQWNKKITDMLEYKEKLKQSEDLQQRLQDRSRILQHKIIEKQKEIQELTEDNKKLTKILSEYTDLKFKVDYSPMKELHSSLKPYNLSYDSTKESDAVKTKKQLETLQDYLKVILQERHNLYLDNCALKEKVDALNTELQGVKVERYFNKLQILQWKERVFHLNNALNEAQGKLGCMSTQLNQQVQVVTSLKYRFML